MSVRFLCVAVALLACEDTGGGPHERIHLLTGCVAPADAVRLHDHVGGNAARFVFHAKIVMPKDAFPDFMSSCRLDRDDMTTGYDRAAMAPAESLAWWDPPHPAGVMRVERRGGERYVQALVFERDTDAVVYLRSEGR